MGVNALLMIPPPWCFELRNSLTHFFQPKPKIPHVSEVLCMKRIVTYVKLRVCVYAYAD